MVVLLVLQAIIALALIGVILMQKSEGGGPLGMGGQSGSGGSGNMFTSRGAANFLTRTTAVLAALFMGNCLLMTIVAGKQLHRSENILQVESPAEPAAAESAPVSDADVAPAAPQGEAN